MPLRLPRPSFLREEDLPPPRPRTRPKSFGDGDCQRTVRLRQLIYSSPPMCRLLRLMAAKRDVLD